MRDDIKEVYFTEEQLHEKVAELGARITEDYRDKNPLIVSVLKGSYVFMADLTRAIDTPCNVDFMVVSSYGKGTVCSVNNDPFFSHCSFVCRNGLVT